MLAGIAAGLETLRDSCGIGRRNQSPSGAYAITPSGGVAGRMVGLVRLGDTAWAVGRRKPLAATRLGAHPALFALVAGAIGCSPPGWRAAAAALMNMAETGG